MPAFRIAPARSSRHTIALSKGIGYQAMALLIAALLLSPVLHGQRCLEVDIAALMGQYLHVPGDPAANFNLCKTRVNENGQVEIVDHGQDLTDLDTMVTRNARKFNDAALQASMGGMSGAQSVQNSQELAAKLQSMSPEEQKAWAMQYAAQQMQDPHARPLPEDPKMAKLFGKVNDLFVQIGQLNSAFSAQFLTLSEGEASELDKVPEPDGKGCPEVGKEGQPSCSCINGVYGKYFQSKLAIEKEYDARRIEALVRQIAQVKALVVQAEADISTLRNGDALNNPTFKKQLLSYQAGIFSGAFSQVGSAIEHIRTESSDLYVNKVNCDKLKYQLWCD